MATYLVRLRGENFLIDGDKGPRKKRFRATRLVEAGEQKRAEALAVDMIREDIHSRNTVLNDLSDPPIIDLESVHEISATPYDVQNRAYAFYWEDEDPDA